MLALLSHPRLSILSLSRLFMPVSSSFSMPALSSYPFVLALLFPPIPALLSCFLVPALLFCFSILALLSLSVLTLLSLLVLVLLSYSVFGLAPTCLTFLAFKTFKRVLLDEPLGCQSTSSSLSKSLCLFPVLGPLLEKSNCKQLFDMMFINSCPLAANHAVKKVDLSFEKCKYLAPVKLNRL